MTDNTGIFISYRRDDASYPARAIYERLGREFGTQAVFMDIEGLEYGEDFVETLERRLAQCQVMLALIGPKWLAVTDARGRRRLDSSQDFVRIEIRTALGRPGVKVVPVLTDGAEMPEVSELPEDLQPLVRRQALQLRIGSFDADLRQLSAWLRRTLEVPTAAVAEMASDANLGQEISAHAAPAPPEAAQVAQAPSPPAALQHPAGERRAAPSAAAVAPATSGNAPNPEPAVLTDGARVNSRTEPKPVANPKRRLLLAGGTLTVGGAGLWMLRRAPAPPLPAVAAPAPVAAAPVAPPVAAPAEPKPAAPTSPPVAATEKPKPKGPTDQTDRPAWAKAAGQEWVGRWADLAVGGVLQRLRWIQPGEFMMGSPKDELERDDDEGPQHRVRLTEGFWLADTACTQALWLAVAGGANPSSFKGELQNPVETVNWDDVQAFLKKLKDALDAVAEPMLPTEAQWEYACRASTKAPFSFGASVTTAQVNYDGNHPYGSSPKGEIRARTLPVKALPPNGWGLYQMHGNVWEWCADGERTYAAAKGATAVENPIGPQEQGSEASRVLRGGSWAYGARDARSAYRNAIRRDGRDISIGFRLALRS